MTYTKTITQDIDWLNAIDGLTVAKAIEYLSTLNPEHVLNYNLMGDTHGVDITSDVSYEVPMTNKEILEKLEVKYTNEILIYKTARLKHVGNDNHEGIARCDKQIAHYQKLIDEARAKYGS
jgi:hypothetical protein